MYKAYVIASKMAVEKIRNERIYLIEEEAIKTCDEVNKGYLDLEKPPFKVYPIYLSFHHPYECQT